MTSPALLTYIADAVRIARENGPTLCRNGHPACSHLFNGPCHDELLSGLTEHEIDCLEAYESQRENDR